MLSIPTVGQSHSPASQLLCQCHTRAVIVNRQHDAPGSPQYGGAGLKLWTHTQGSMSSKHEVLLLDCTLHLQVSGTQTASDAQAMGYLRQLESEKNKHDITINLWQVTTPV